jgi:hypothetical protein
MRMIWENLMVTSIKFNEDEEANGNTYNIALRVLVSFVIVMHICRKTAKTWNVQKKIPVIFKRNRK